MGPGVLGVELDATAGVNLCSVEFTQHQGRLGGVLWAASAVDGSKLAEYKLDVLPAWDGMAAAYGRLFIVNRDGSIECWGAGPK